MKPIAGILTCLVSLATVSAGDAQEITLRAITSFAEGTQFSANFERFVDKVNKDGKGIIQINFIGGPRALPPFEVGNALRSGVVDVANVASSFYTNIMPEADAFKLIVRPTSELRKNGTWDYLKGLYAQKINAHLLMRQFHNVPFHIYLNKKIDTLDLTGLKIRVTPAYRDLIQELGGTPITTAPGEVYTALERGVVDGYGWASVGIFDLGWDKVTKFRVDPSFYCAEVNVLVNLAKWNQLNEAQQKVLNEAAAWLEELDKDNDNKNKQEYERQNRAGIVPLVFGESVSKNFLAKAYDVAWRAVIAKNPEIGTKLRSLSGN